ncbi:hypothetical protein ACWIGW_22205 [Nocardia brasiliensis]
MRIGLRTVDVLVLGDSCATVRSTVGTTTTHTDNRLSDLNLPEAEQYRNRLAHGHGYDETHRGILASLQRAERRRRNRQGGYWIAEADPIAAYQSVTATYLRGTTKWAILATDGATDTAPQVIPGWPSIAASADSAELLDLLRRCHDWEANTDPNGIRVPRSKRHDDKTVAVVHF